MNKPVTIAVLRSGLLAPALLAEVNRWGLPVRFIEKPKMLDDLDEIVSCLREAVEGDDTIKLRDTDLDSLSFFLQQHRTGKLVIPSNDTRNGTVAVTVEYAVLPSGRYLIPWVDDETLDILTDPKTYLKTDTEKVQFQEAEELFFGDTKAFMSARPLLDRNDP